MKNKEWDEKLDVESIDFGEVFNYLDRKTTFTNRDIRVALKKTGRSFNENGIFYGVTRLFISKLGDAVIKTKEGREYIYTIPDYTRAYNIMNPKKCCSKVSSSIEPVEKVNLVVEEKTESIPEPEKKEIPQNLIKDIQEETRDLVKKVLKSYSGSIRGLRTILQDILSILAVFTKYNVLGISMNIMKAELTENFMNNWTYFLNKVTNSDKVYKIMNLFGVSLDITGAPKSKKDRFWNLEIPNSDNIQDTLLEVMIKVEDVYRSILNESPQNYDEYLKSAVKEENSVADKDEVVDEEIQEATQEEPKTNSLDLIKELVKIEHIPTARTENDPEKIWKKWLLTSAIQYRFGKGVSITEAIKWISCNRYYEISEEEAFSLIREMQHDLGRAEFELIPGDRVNMTERAYKILLDAYSPKDITETILIKVKLTPEEATTAFPELTWRLDETTTSGNYIYEVTIDRSYSSEVALIRLLSFIQISGKIYTGNSWILDRIKNLISLKNAAKKPTHMMLLGLESKN